jgi:hypothetical protein
MRAGQLLLRGPQRALGLCGHGLGGQEFIGELGLFLLPRLPEGTVLPRWQETRGTRGIARLVPALNKSLDALMTGMAFGSRRVGEISGVPQRLSDRTYATMSSSS